MYTNNSPLNIPSYFYREYSHDFPEQENGSDYSSQALRIFQTALPFITLYQPIGRMLALGLGITRTITTFNQSLAAQDSKGISQSLFHTSLALGSVAGTIFLHPLGMFIATTQDLGLNCTQIYESLCKGEMLETSKQMMHITNNSFYLMMILHGSVELQLASLAIQVLVEGSSSLEEFSKGNTLEALGHLGMCTIRMNQSIREFHALNTVKAMPIPKNEKHVIKGKNFEWDPHEGDHIDEYVFWLDDGTFWKFNWFIYERYQLNIRVGDVIEIRKSPNGSFFMNIHTEQGIKTVEFERNSNWLFTSVSMFFISS